MRRHFKTAWIATSALVLVTLVGGCRDNRVTDSYDGLPAPSGVHTITGDGVVELVWNAVHDVDLSGYSIYRSLHAGGPYARIGYSVDTYYRDEQVSNGITYYYAVAAYDWRGREGDLSYETVFDTPRPEGRITIYDEDARAGVDFSGYYQYMVLPWDDPYTDMYLQWGGDRFELVSTDVELDGEIYGTDLQEAGWVESLDELDWAPEGGWTLDHADVVPLYQGHAYLVWTWDNHFAKFRVRELGYDFVVLDWAYQADKGNPELTVIPGSGAAGDPTTTKAPRGVATKTFTTRSRPQRGSTAGVAGGSH